MARAYFCAYYSYADFLEELTDEEAGRLMRAVFLYAKEGEMSDLAPLERMAYRAICSQIDRDNNRYEEVCEARRESALKRFHGEEEGEAMQLHTNAAKDKKKKKEKENSIEKASDIEIVEEKETLPHSGGKVDNSVENHYRENDPYWEERQKLKTRAALDYGF